MLILPSLRYELSYFIPISSIDILDVKIKIVLGYNPKSISSKKRFHDVLSCICIGIFVC